MKKSKIMKALLVFGMSVVTATAVAGITACGDEHEHVDADNNGKCDICDTDMTPSGGGETVKVDVEKVELNKDELTLEVGGEETLTATVTPDNADNKTVTWASSNTSVATVTGGKVTAVAAGTATITATADGKSATCNVTVTAPAPKPEVGAEEWAAALSETAFTNFTSSTKMSNAEEGAAGIIYKVDLPNGKYYHNDGGDTYYSKEADKYYKYSKAEDSEEYVKEDSTEEDYNNGLLTESSALHVTIFKDCFDDVEYNTETESYIGTGIELDGVGGTFNIEFKFNHGKLVYAEVDFGEDANFIFEYSNYGTTTVKLPTIGGETEKVDVEKVELNKDELTLEVGGEETLTATVTPDDADDKTVTWASSNTSVATVDESGKVTAVAAGTATITATADGKSATCSVTVNTPTPSEIPNITEWAYVGDPIYNPDTVGDVDYIYHHIFFNDADAKAYDFDSYDATVTVDGNPGEIVEIVPMGAGEISAHTYHLKIRIKANKYQTAVFNITFKKGDEVKATGTYTRVGDREIILDNDELSVSTTATEPTLVTVLQINGSTNVAGKQIAWEISDTNVATIVDNGNGTVSVKGVAEGTATLTCTVGTGDNAFSTTCAIKVVAGEVKDEDPVDVSAQLHEQEVYGAWNICIRLDCDADLGNKIKSVEVTGTMDGNTTNVAVHEVYGEGGPKYVKMGVSQDWSHDYVFTLNYKNAAGKVIATGTFIKAAPASLSLDPSTLNLTLKENETVTGTITATTKKVEGTVQWSIADEDIATITDNGDGTVTVTAVAKGTTTITATVGGLTKTCTVNVIEEGGTVQVPTVTKARIHVVYGGGVHCGVILDGADDLASTYAEVLSKFAYVKVNGTKNNDMKDMFTFGADGSYRVNVYMGGAVQENTDYVFELCDADGNVLLKTVALQKTDATVIDP